MAVYLSYISHSHFSEIPTTHPLLHLFHLVIKTGNKKDTKTLKTMMKGGEIDTDILDIVKSREKS
jgi:hypothetical protein